MFSFFWSPLWLFFSFFFSSFRQSLPRWFNLKEPRWAQIYRIHFQWCHMAFAQTCEKRGEGKITIDIVEGFFEVTSTDWMQETRCVAVNHGSAQSPLTRLIAVRFIAWHTWGYCSVSQIFHKSREKSNKTKKTTTYTSKQSVGCYTESGNLTNPPHQSDRSDFISENHAHPSCQRFSNPSYFFSVQSKSSRVLYTVQEASLSGHRTLCLFTMAPDLLGFCQCSVDWRRMHQWHEDGRLISSQS